MDLNELVPRTFDLPPYRLGLPQQSGALTVLPVFGPDRNGKFSGPLTGLKVSAVRGYGHLELGNPAPQGLAIVPLHIGYIQDQAQNHALCQSAFIAAGQKKMFDDACCVQASQGGYLAEKEQWFFILPLQLRAEALQLRGQASYSKLWGAISRLNQRLGLPQVGHLEQIISRKRAFLTQYQSRLELLPGQTGALFFLRDKLVGIEMAPGAGYFQEVWMPLLCFCYGVAAMEIAPEPGSETVTPFPAVNLQELRQQLDESRLELQERVMGWLAQAPREKFQKQEEERFLNFRLHTVTGKNFTGQVVEENVPGERMLEGAPGSSRTEPETISPQLVYASLFATPEYLYSG